MHKTVPSPSRSRALALACLAAVAATTPLLATPTVTTFSDHYVVNNGTIVLTYYNNNGGSNAGKITSITYAGQQMVGTKGIYADIQGTPNIYLGTGDTYSVVTGSNYVDLQAFHPATAAEPLDVTWHYIIKDGDAGYSTYLTYDHTAAMADYSSSENRESAEFFNNNLFHYSSITDNFWGYQDAGDPSRAQGRFITAETEDVRGVPGEYIKNYETKYDWRTTYQNSSVIGIATAANTSAATRPISGADYGVWAVYGYRAYESWNAGPTHPQTPVADGASIIPSPPGSHFGGPGLVYTGNMSKSFGPFFTYFNTGTDLASIRADATKYTTQNPASPYDLNTFYDSLNLHDYTPTNGRGNVNGQLRTADGTSMAGATIILSTFNAAQYAADPLGQEYQRRAAGYNYWVTPNADGTFSLPGVIPGTYRVTVIKPGYYREGTFDNITVSAGQTTATGNLTWTPDLNGKSIWQVGTFDRTSAEFRDGANYNNWLDTFNLTKEFPNGVNYTVNPANPLNDTANWSQNWGRDQINNTLDFWKVNFTLPSAPAANSTVTLTVSIAGQEFINDLAVLIGSHRADVSFDHTADNAPDTFRSGDTTSSVLYRTFNIPASWLVAGNNTFNFHIVGGDMQWDAINLSIQNPGTFSVAQWNGGNGVWTDPSQWSTQQNGYTSINKGTAALPNNTSTTFADGAAHTAPINNTGSQNFYDAFINGGNVSLPSSVAVQKLSLLTGTLSIASNATLTANDAFVFAGANVVGPGTINALSTTTINFNNTLSAGGKIVSTGPVSWLDTGTVTISGTGSKWTTPGLSFGQTGASGSLTVSTGGAFSAGANPLILGAQGLINLTGATLTAASLSTAGTFVSTSSTVTLTGAFTNSGNASLDGGLSATNVLNTAGLLTLAGTNAYTGNTSITGGTVQFSATSAIGGSGASVTVGPGGAISYYYGTNDGVFLSRINPASTGAFALTSADASTPFDFTTPLFSNFPAMALGALGNVTYTGAYTPAGNLYRLGGGGGILTFSPLISSSAAVAIGNTNSTGTVILNSANNYTGTTSLNGGILSTPLLANGNFPSPLGASSNAPANLVFNGGTLQYTGPATSTDRLFTLTQNGGTLDASGTGSLIFSNSNPLTSTGTGNRTLALLGNSTASNIFAPGIADPSSGSTALTKDGAGTWILGSGAKTYSGDTTLLNGTLQLSTGATLPNGLGKGNLVIETTATFNLAGNDVAINALNDGPIGNITTANPTGWASPNGPGGGSVTNSGPLHTLTLGNGNASGLFSGVLSGNLSLIKNGTGNQILSGDNTYTGTTTINAGSLTIGIGGTPSSFGPGDGGFRGMLGSGTITNNAALIYNRGYLTTVSNLITGTGALKQTANAELILANNANAYTGPTLIGQGIANIGLGGPTDGTGLAYSGDSSINAGLLANGGVNSSIGASSSAASNLILDGGTLFSSSTSASSTNRLFTVTQNGGAIYASGALNFTGPGAVAMTGTGNRTLSLGGNGTTSATFNLAIGDPTSGITSLTKDRSNTFILTANATLTYSGDTTILAGILQLGAGAALPFGPGKGNLVMPLNQNYQDGTNYLNELQMAGNNVQINGLSGGNTSIVNNNSGTHTLSVGNNNATAQFDGVLSGGLTLNKVGAGIETLTGTNTYTGATQLTAGELSVSATTNLGSAANTISFTGGTLQITGTTLTAPNRTVTWSPAGGGFDIANPANTFTVSSPLSGGPLMKLGAGALILASNISLSGASTLTGPLTLSAPANSLGTLTGNGSLTVTSALTSDGLQINTLILNGSTKIRTNGSPTGTSRLQSLTLNTASSLDITNNDLIVEATPATLATTLSTLQTEATAATLFSSYIPTAPNALGLAVVSNAALPTPKTTFGGLPVDANSLLIAPELLGDSNLDGKVDLNDLNTVLNHLGSTTSLWTNGNFDNAPTIDLNDLNAVLNNLGVTYPAGAAALADLPTQTPEPASFMLLIAACPLLCPRRKRLTS